MTFRRIFPVFVLVSAVIGATLGALVSSARATNCSSYPFTLTNGTVADANQVMSNFNSILSCANANLAHNGVNSDITQLTAVTNLAFAGANSNITSLTGLTTPLAVSEGGTGGATQSAARTGLGLGTSAVENLLSNIVDNGSGSLTVGNSGVTGGSYTYTTLTVSNAGIITAASNGTAPAAAATNSQMETGTATTVFANPANVFYSDAGVKGWVGFKYASATLTIFTSENATVSRNSAGNFTLTMQNGFSFAGGSAVCTGHNSGNPIIAAAAGGLAGVNPTQEIDFINTGGTPTDPGDFAMCTVVGHTTN